MIVSRTPFRISFFGGGTDYPDWYTKNDGNVLSTTIDKYSYIYCRKLPPFFNYKYRVSYSKIELERKLSNIKHKAIKEIIKISRIRDGLEINHIADLPGYSGLGSSSSFVVGLINALERLKGNSVSKKFLMNEAINIEQNILHENVGSQDQAAVAYGGLNRILFKKNRNILVKPVKISYQRKTILNNHLLLFHTGKTRIASKIVKDQVNNIPKNSAQLNKMASIVNDAVEILESNSDIRQFGELLNYSWGLKKSLSNKISDSFFDKLFIKAQNSGAIGGKLLGAGSGGFMLLFAEPKNQYKIKKAFNNLVHVQFNFETLGSQSYQTIKL